MELTATHLEADTDSLAHLSDQESIKSSADIDEVFRKLTDLVKPVEALLKERKGLKNPPLLLKILSGEIPAEEELQTIKEDLKQLQKLVKLSETHQIALKEAQKAMIQLDSVLGNQSSPIREIIQSVTHSTETTPEKMESAPNRLNLPRSIPTLAQ